MPPRGPGQRKNGGRPRGPGQADALPVQSLQETKDALRQQLLGYHALTTEVGQTLQGLARGQLGYIAGNTMAAQSQVRQQINSQLAPIQAAVSDASHGAKSQLMGEIGNVLATAQSAVPEFPDAVQLASELYPSHAQTFSGVVNPGGNDPSACLAAAAQNYAQQLASIAPLYQQDPGAYANAAAMMQNVYMAAIAACSGQGSGGPGQPGSGGTPGLPIGGPSNPLPVRTGGAGGQPTSSGPQSGPPGPAGGPLNPGGPGIIPGGPGKPAGVPGSPVVGPGGIPGNPLGGPGQGVGGPANPFPLPPAPVVPGGPGTGPSGPPIPGQPGQPGPTWPTPGPPAFPGGPPVLPNPLGPPITGSGGSSGSSPGGVSSAGSEPSPTCVPGLGTCCDKNGTSWSVGQIQQSIQSYFDNTQNLPGACESFTSAYGIQVTPIQYGTPCPAGAVALGINTGAVYDPAMDACVACGSTTPTTGPPTCCPVNVTVNVPPTSSAPTPAVNCGVNVYKTVEGLCYVIASTQKPRSSSDVLVGNTADSVGLTFNQLNQICQQAAAPQPGPGQTAGMPNLGNVNACSDMLRAVGITGQPEKYLFSWFLGLVDANGKPLPSGVSTGSTLVDNVFSGLIKLIAQPLDAAGSWITGFLNNSPCQSPEYLSLTLTRLVLGVVQNFTGGSVESLLRPAEQNARYICPVELPGGDKAIEAYLTNTIDMPTAVCWARADNNTESEWRSMLDSRQTRWNALEAVQLWKRNFITEQQCNDTLRTLGYTDPNNVAGVKELATQIPPASDLVMFMVRDVEDPNIVNKFNLDQDFQVKFAGKVKEWAGNQGVSEEYMQRIWRAHWQIPSPTQLFDFYHRTRTDPKFGGEPAVWDDVSTALSQQDIPEYWQKYFRAVSFRPLTRIDVRRAYSVGSLDDAGFTEAMIQLGYSDDNAAKLLAFTKDQKQATLGKDPIVKAYADGLVNVSEVTAQLTAGGATQDTIDKVLARADLNRTIAKRKACHAGWKKRYLTGELKEDYVTSLLIQDGLNSDVAQSLIEGWTCEKASKGKTIPAATLCKWFSDGIITSPDYFTRLNNLGYSSDDALAIVQECELRLQLAQSKSAQKLAKQAAQAERQAEAALRREQAAATKATNQQTAALNKARAVQKRRRGLILEIGFEFAKVSGLDAAQAVADVEGISQLIAQQGPYPIDSVLESGVRLAKLPTMTTPELLAAEWLAEMTALGSDAQNP